MGELINIDYPYCGDSCSPPSGLINRKYPSNDGSGIDAIASAGAGFVDRARRRIALQFAADCWSPIAGILTGPAAAALGMSRDLGFVDGVLGMGMGIFFCQLCGVADSRRPAQNLEQWAAATDDFRDHDFQGSLTALTALMHTQKSCFAGSAIETEAGFSPV